MDNERWNQIKTVFNRALEIETASRADFLNDLGDAELRQEVEKLLASDSAAKTLFDVSPLRKLDDNQIGKHIGIYRIERELGRGGMGAVYLATREDLGKQVALKIIKRGMDTDFIVRRFHHERQILAALDHPNVARLFDAGTTDDGLPFFVMEYVEGEELLKYCEKRELPIPERLRLFRKICGAVQYAHSRLVVHRDLKPSNILVTSDGTPKLLDFGISKLITPEAEAPTGTATALGMMTPNYASPEQYRGETVGTSTDVYSLGVILFELLTGALPYDFENVRLDDRPRVVCEIEPRRPSQAISDFGFQTADLKKTKNDDKITNQNEPKTNPKSQMRNPKSLRGDLDNIVLKALKKEPERRYATVEQFSEDIRRHLAGLPVTARADTFSYRASKFMRRNRTSVAAASLVVLALVGGVAGTTWQAVRAEHQRALAEKRFGEVRQIANNVIFNYYDEIKNLEGATKARKQIITDAATYLENIETGEGGDPQLKNEIGRAYLRLGEMQGGNAEANIGDSAASLESFERAVRLLDEAAQAAPSDDFTLDLMYGLNRYGMQLVRAKDYKRAQAQFNRAVELIGNVKDEKRLSAKREDGASMILVLGESLLNLCQSAPSGTEEGESVGFCERSRDVFLTELNRTPPTVENGAARFDIYQGLIAAEQQLGIAYLILADATNGELEPERKKSLYRQALPHLRRSGDYARELLEPNPNDERVRTQILFSALYETTAQRGAGETESALATQLKLLEDARTAAAGDEENAEARYDIFRILDQIALTYAAQKNFDKSLEIYEQAEKVISELVSSDAGNAEAQIDKFNLILKIGETQIEKGEYNRAESTFKRALSFAKSAVQLKNTPYGFYAEGVYEEELSLIKRTSAEKGIGLPKSERLRLLAESKKGYEKALEMWKQKTGELEEFGIDEDKIKNTENKIAQCERLAERLEKS